MRHSAFDRSSPRSRRGNTLGPRYVAWSECRYVPEAAKGILNWISESGLTVPALPVQSALIQCCAERPQILISHLQHTEGPVREVLARVLGEVATPALQTSLMQFVDDELPELRVTLRGPYRSLSPRSLWPL